MAEEDEGEVASGLRVDYCRNIEEFSASYMELAGANQMYKHEVCPPFF
jgi:hypothetical protein